MASTSSKKDIELKINLGLDLGIDPNIYSLDGIIDDPSVNTREKTGLAKMLYTMFTSPCEWNDYISKSVKNTKNIKKIYDGMKILIEDIQNKKNSTKKKEEQKEETKKEEIKNELIKIIKNNTLVSDEHKNYVNEHKEEVVNNIYSIRSQFDLTTENAFNQLKDNNFNLEETIKKLKKKGDEGGEADKKADKKGDEGGEADKKADDTAGRGTNNEVKKNSSSKKTLESLFSFGNKDSGTMLVEQLKNTMNITSSNNNLVERLKNAFTNIGIVHNNPQSDSSKGGGNVGNVEKIIKKKVSISEINIENLVRANNSLAKLHGTIKKDQSMIKKERLDAATSIQYLISLFALGKKNEKNQLEKYYRDTKKKDSLKDVISELLQYLSITRNEIPDMQ